MKLSSIIKVAVLAMPLMFTSCIFHKKHVQEPVRLTPEQMAKANLIDRVRDNVQTGKFITSKVKFSVEVGPQKLTLTGNLKMKRDDVIRLQLMAFGFVEAGRIELTKDYILIMDRINKQYLKAPYIAVDFLRNSGMDFDALQSLFWNELFLPKQAKEKKGKNVERDSTNIYSLMESGDDMIVSIEEGRMDYSWLVSRQDAHIRMANVLYKDWTDGQSQLNWDYDEFEEAGRKLFPTKSVITLTTPKKELKLGMKLTYIEADTEWETRTVISDKYSEVTVDEILRRFMAL